MELRVAMPCICFVVVLYVLVLCLRTAYSGFSSGSLTRLFRREGMDLWGCERLSSTLAGILLSEIAPSALSRRGAGVSPEGSESEWPGG